MIKHIVLFKLKKIHVGLNINPAEKWDIALETEFNTLEDLSIYANHPKHVEISKNLIGPVKEDRACVDFTLPQQA